MTPLVFLHGVGGGPRAWKTQPIRRARIPLPSPGTSPATARRPCRALRPGGHLRARSRAPRRARRRRSCCRPQHGRLHRAGNHAGYPREERLARALTSPAFGRRHGELPQVPAASGSAPSTRAKPWRRSAAARRYPRTGQPLEVEARRADHGGVPPETYRKAVLAMTTFDRSKELGGHQGTAARRRLGNATPAVGDGENGGGDPGRRVRAPQGCGHLPPMDRPQEFNAALLALLKRPPAEEARCTFRCTPDMVSV